MTRKRANPWPVDFWTYFGVADEIYDSVVRKQDQTKPFVDIMTDALTLADLEPKFVESAKAWAEEHDAPWPPYLPWAEEYSLDHRRNCSDEAHRNSYDS